MNALRNPPRIIFALGVFTRILLVSVIPIEKEQVNVKEKSVAIIKLKVMFEGIAEILVKTAVIK